MDLVSGLAFLDIDTTTEPFTVVSEFLNEAKEHGVANPIMSLATSSLSGDVTNRSVILKEYKDDKFIFVTDDRSEKSVQIEENSRVAACLLFQYKKKNQMVTRQIRIEGAAKKLPYELTEKYWKSEPLFAQIRTLIAKDVGKINWDEKLKRHDELLSQAKSGQQFKMPEYHVSFEIIPHGLHFYHGVDMLIADKVDFKKGEDNKWSFKRVV